MKNDLCSAKHRMPFLQNFADQLSQTAASLPGANVKHPSSAAVWAYAHLDIPVAAQVGIGSLEDTQVFL